MPSKANKKLAHQAKKEAEAAAAALNVASVVKEDPIPAVAPPAEEKAVVEPEPTPPVVAEIVAPTVPAVPISCVDFPDSLSPFAKSSSQLVSSNSYSVTIKATKVYRYDVSLLRYGYACRRKNDDGSVVEVEACSRELAGSDGGNRERQAMFLKTLRLALELLGVKAHPFAYDGGTALFTPRKLPKLDECVIESTDLPADLKREYFDTTTGKIAISFKEARSAVLNTGDFYKESLHDMVPREKTITNVLQIALTQKARDDGFQIVEGGREMFERNSAAVHEGIETRKGISVSIRVADGSEGKGQAQLLIDYKTIEFFGKVSPAELAIFKDYTVHEHPNVEKYMRGMAVESILNCHRFTILSITREAIKDVRLESGESALDAARKELKRCNEALAEKIVYNKNNPAVVFIEKKTKKKFYWPMEHLRMTGDQKMQPRHELKQSAQPPRERFTETERLARKASLFTGNGILDAFGVKIDPYPIRLNAFSVPCATVVYSSGRPVYPNQKGSWNIPTFVKESESFIEPKSIPEIVILYNSGTDGNTVEKFAGLLQSGLETNARTTGMSIGRIRTEDIRRYTPHTGSLDDRACEAIRKRTEELKTLNPPPYCYYIDKKARDTHAMVKYQERLCQMPIQQACIDKSLKKVEGRSTILNLLAKMNTKMGGFNHKAKVDSSIEHLFGDKSNSLILSYDVCHASGAKVYTKGEFCDEPSSVGFAYNTLRNRQKIIGDFHLQSTRQEEVNKEILVARSKHILTDYFNSHRRVPDHVIVIRDGVSEGQFQMVKGEFAHIVGAMTALLAANKAVRVPKFALLVVTKRHAHRMYQSGFDNVSPLTAVDTNVVRKNANEVIFVSHYPVKGTSQPQLLNLLHNEGVFKSNTEMVKLLAALCMVHQPTAGLISLPETINSADKYAERGAKLFSIYMKLRAASRDFPLMESGSIDFEKATEALCYRGTRWQTVQMT